jgi:hypothetical protein
MGYALPSAVAEVLRDNGPFDGRSAPGSFWSGDWGVTVDDVILPGPSRVDSMTGQFALASGRIAWAKVSLWQLPVRGGEPGTGIVVRYVYALHYERIGELKGYPVYSITADNLNIDLPAGDYYFGMQIGTAFAYLCTAGNGQLNGYGAGWYTGVPLDDWWPVRWLLGYDSDFAFKLKGIPEPGACLPLLAAPRLHRRRGRVGLGRGDACSPTGTAPRGC